MKNFDSEGVGKPNGAYFGMPFSVAEADLALISVPWDVTSSYGGGSAEAPAAIIEASTQLDFYDPQAPDAWRRGIATVPIDYAIWQSSNELRPVAEGVIEALENDAPVSTETSGASTAELAPELVEGLARINKASENLNAQIEKQAAKLLADNKLVGLVGGDHSTPYGLLMALGAAFEARGESFGILHLDAHCDLRERYEGFEHSHASIMYNVLRDVPQVSHVVQVGVRDFSRTELETARKSLRVKQFTGSELAAEQFRGVMWAEQCEMIVNALPSAVYVSFDIDFLSPEFCPGTGTPVPGGRSFDEAAYLIEALRVSGRKIVGFDLCEVSPRHPIDAIVGARILFKLCGQILSY